jgi:hypothetical protein
LLGKPKSKKKNTEDTKDDILMMKLNSRFQEVAVELFSLGTHNTQTALQKVIYNRLFSYLKDAF